MSTSSAAYLFLALIAGVAAVAPPAPAPAPAAGAHVQQAWAARLHHEVGPVLGQCVWAEMSRRVQPGRLTPLLARAEGGQATPQLDGMVRNAVARCSPTKRVLHAAG